MSISNTYLVVLDNGMVIPKLSAYHVVEVTLHLLQFSGQSLESVDLVYHDLAQLTLTCVLDVSQQMLDTNLLSFGSSNGGWHIGELAIDLAVGICLLL